ncbi:MAG TPA: VOC family protein [Burkholderiaceae bacterium]
MRMLVNIDVPDLRLGVDFYSAALGLNLNRMLDDDVAELSGGAATVYLLRKEEGTAPAASVADGRTYVRHWTSVHVDFVVDDLQDAIQRAENAGAKRESACVCWRGSRCVTFCDPFGNGFCLIAFDEGTYSDVPDQS